MQSASLVFMVRPARFGFNAETAGSNYFQQAVAGLDEAQAQARAFAEFDGAVATLRRCGVRVLVFDDTAAPAKPDAVFPNNWVSLHADGTAVLYPLCAPNRRPERRADILDALRQEFVITQVLDLSGYEREGRFLEGTGSIIFDHVHRIAYACLSPRTDAGLLADVAGQLGYRPLAFRAQDGQGNAIYHTNVMMCVGATVAVVCLASIRDPAERAGVLASLIGTGHKVVDISLEQVGCFAGNMLTLHAAAAGRELLVLSQSAFDALTDEQRQVLSCHCQLVPLRIPTIETLGGGSARCMLAEVFLPAASE